MASITVTYEDRVLREMISNTGKEQVRVVSDGVNYGIHQEFGTVKMKAHPFMVPAVEQVRPGFSAAIAMAFRHDVSDERIDDILRKVAHDVVAIAMQLAPVDTGALKNSIHMVTKNEAKRIVGGGE